jgi:hypothetical protein
MVSSTSAPAQKRLSPHTVHRVGVRLAAKPPSGDDNGSIGGGVSQGSCSITQVGGSNNQATTNCLPPPAPNRTLSAKAFLDFRASLTVLGLPRPIVGIEVVGNDTDMPAFPDQIVDAFDRAGWEVRKSLTGSLVSTTVSDSGMVTSNGAGLHCGALDKDGAEVKKAMEAFNRAGMACSTDGTAFPRNGEVFVVRIGPKVRTN